MDKTLILLIISGVVLYIISTKGTLGLINTNIPTKLLAGQSINPITGQIQTARGVA